MRPSSAVAAANRLGLRAPGLPPTVRGRTARSALRFGEEALDAAWCMASGRRAVAKDPREDLRIAVVEAAARSEPVTPPAFFLGLVGADEPEVVRWTGARLAVEVHGDRLDPRSLPRDPSPLVQRRLDAVGGR